jgi:general L-amino acid transport system substrate-binding protein
MTVGRMRQAGAGSAIGAAMMLAAMLAATPVDAATVLERVRANGAVRCAVDYTPGFSAIDPAAGRPVGMDVDICRAVAAAALGEADAIETLRVNTANKFKGVAAGELDIALGMATWTYSRDAALGVAFPAVIYYDGQGFMTWSDSGAARLSDLRDKKICVQSGTTSQANLEDLQRREGIRLIEVAAKSSEEKFSAFSQRQCDAVTGDRSELAARRADMGDMRARWVILPEAVSREPLAPAVAENDAQWTDIVRWVINVLIIAEQKGLTSANIDSLEGVSDGETRRLLGKEEGFGAKLGLDDQWARRVISQVGNYGEIFARRLGTDTPIGLDRGLNAPWTRGGLLYAPPLR